MKILGFNISKKTQEAPKKKKRLSTEVNEPRPVRAKMELDKWRLNIEAATQVEMPRFDDLYEMYKLTLDDEEVIAQKQIALAKLEAEPFAISTNGEDNDELTKLFKNKWFTDFLYCCFDADLWGYTLAEAGQLNDAGIFRNFDVFNHKNTYPKIRGVIKEYYDTEGYSLEDVKEATAWGIIELGDPKGLGLLKVLTKIVIQKTFSESDWDRYNEKYGLPHLAIGTDADGKELDAIEKAAQNFNNNSYLVGDIDVEKDLKLIEAKGGGQHETFSQRIEAKNKAIAKMINGQQATTDTQAWTGSARVQQQTYIDMHTSRLRRYSNIVNDQLIDFLRYWGYQLPEGAQFRYLSLDDKQATPKEENPATEDIDDPEENDGGNAPKATLKKKVVTAPPTPW